MVAPPGTTHRKMLAARHGAEWFVPGDSVWGDPGGYCKYLFLKKNFIVFANVQKCPCVFRYCAPERTTPTRYALGIPGARR